jgi:pyruvate/2-oxoglutarate dehydrogenase complex dihydrolipoamide acyltransferase (E2) component
MMDLTARKINPNDDHIRIGQWHVRNRDFVKKGQDLLDVSTSKVNVTLQSESQGFLEILKKEGQRVRIGEVYARYYNELSEIPEATSLNPENFNSSARQSSLQSFDFVRFSDAAHSLILEHGLDKGLFAGMGLVTAGQVNQKIQSLLQKNPDLLPTIFTNPYRTQGTSASKEVEIQQLTIGQSGRVNSQLCVQFLADTIQLSLNRGGSKAISMLSLILYEFTQLLTSHPLLTAFFADDKIHYYDEIRLGLALDTGRGLKVVCFPKAEEMAAAQWHENVTELAMKDLRGQLAPEDLSSTTVTVTDLSSLNVLYFHPLINGQQSCILGIGGDSDMPGHPMTLTLNFDHRVLSGREVGEFLNLLKNKIQSYQDL